VRVNDAAAKQGFRYKRTESHTVFKPEQHVNYATPGYATAVFVSASGVERIARRRKVTGASPSSKSWAGIRYIALGSTYGQPTLCLS